MGLEARRDAGEADVGVIWVNASGEITSVW